MPLTRPVCAAPSVPPCLTGAIIKEMGWTALFTRGLPLRIVMIGTLTGACVRAWELAARLRGCGVRDASQLVARV